jgi:NADPH2:quinone reductase
MPVRSPGPGEGLVRLHCSGINPTDVKNRGGVPGRGKSFDRMVTHHDGAGIVEATGQSVPPALQSQSVWIFCAQHEMPFGTASEYITIGQEFIGPLPSSVSFEVGACLGIPAMRAWNAVLGFGPVAGRIVLVTGGAGAVGDSRPSASKYIGALIWMPESLGVSTRS